MAPRELAELERLLRLLRDEQKPAPMLPQLLEMYREWWRENGITPSSKKASESRQSPS